LDAVKSRPAEAQENLLHFFFFSLYTNSYFCRIMRALFEINAIKVLFYFFHFKQKCNLDTKTKAHGE